MDLVISYLQNNFLTDLNEFMTTRGSEFLNGLTDADAITAFVEFLKSSQPTIKDNVSFNSLQPDQVLPPVESIIQRTEPAPTEQPDPPTTIPTEPSPGEQPTPNTVDENPPPPVTLQPTPNQVDYTTVPPAEQPLPSNSE